MKMQAHSSPQPGQLTLGLIYILRNGQRPFLARIERTLAGRELEPVTDLPETLPSVKGLQFLLAYTFLLRKQLEDITLCPVLNSPDDLIIPLHSNIRNPDPVIWRDSIFPHHPNEVYFTLEYGLKKVSCAADLQIQILIEEKKQDLLQLKTRKAEDGEIELIIECLKGKIELPLDLSVRAIDHRGSSSWQIEGSTNDKSVKYGDRVQIEAFYKNTKPLYSGCPMMRSLTYTRKPMKN